MRRYYRNAATGDVFSLPDYFFNAPNGCVPVVVISPENREQVRDLWAAWIDAGAHMEPGIDRLAAALREFANPTPPKPDEPQRLGTVVEDDKGARWARVRHLPSDDLGCDWVGGVPARWAHYEDIDVVRVVSS